jgi:Beta-galactosidase
VQRFILPLTLLLGALSCSAQISTELFGMAANAGVVATWHPEPWPAVSHKGVRLWDTDTVWRNLNPSNGNYDFSTLDRWLQAAYEHDQDVVYTFGVVPQWASSHPNDPICHGGAGTCDPPKDVNPDGSGTDLIWRTFVNALVTHNKNSPTARIQYWEMWNEPHNNFYWNGTYAQLVRMIGDAYSIIKAADSNAVVLSPTLGMGWSYYLSWASGYLAAGGYKYVDTVSTHAYLLAYGKYHPPEAMPAELPAYRQILAKFGLDKKPVWDLEANWGGGRLNDPDLQAAWLSRYYILHVANSISRFYWYSYNGGSLGGLWTPDPHDQTKPGTILKPGIAYQQMYEWLPGATMPNGCQTSGTVWTCSLTRSGGYQGLLVWDTSQSCSKGYCGTSQYAYQGNYVQYRDLNGNTWQINGKTVGIGAKPILLENQ